MASVCEEKLRQNLLPVEKISEPKETYYSKPCVEMSRSEMDAFVVMQESNDWTKIADTLLQHHKTFSNRQYNECLDHLEISLKLFKAPKTDQPDTPIMTAEETLP